MTQVVTLQIMRVAPDHDLSYDVSKRARRYRIGDIVQVMETALYATQDGDDWRWNEPIGSPRMAFIHIRNIPDARAARMKERFMHRARRNDDENADEDVVRRRRWCFDIAGLAGPKKVELNANKEITLAWNAARKRIRRKHIVVELDADADDITAEVQDSDLPG